jgi:glycosyltransferase involved in cell wall biosynthesis
MKKVLDGASYLLPNSKSEYDRLKKNFAVARRYRVIPNGVSELFIENNEYEEKDASMVICVARVEGIKNQLNLVKALRNTDFKLSVIGGFSPNQEKYYKECKRLATSNITFIQHLPQPDLIKFYKKAKVHILPSWFETTGLSSLEAAVLGCNVVITDRGDAKEYLNKYAFYCDPALPQSIFEAVDAASKSPVDPELAEMVKRNYSWKKAAEETYEIYKQVLKIPG